MRERERESAWRVPFSELSTAVLFLSLLTCTDKNDPHVGDKRLAFRHHLRHQGKVQPFVVRWLGDLDMRLEGTPEQRCT